MADKSMLGALSSWWDDLRTFTRQADAEAERRFPDQARDESVKNAYRHALGAGRFAQLLGANSGIPLVEAAARGAAKLGGYAWESPHLMEDWGNQKTDTRHDFNANAVGINATRNVSGFQSLADALESYAQSARQETPPEVSERSRGYFTYTK